MGNVEDRCTVDSKCADLANLLWFEHVTTSMGSRCLTRKMRVAFAREHSNWTLLSRRHFDQDAVLSCQTEVAVTAGQVSDRIQLQLRPSRQLSHVHVQLFVDV